MMKTFKIAVYPGDGIGGEVTDQAVRVLQRVQDQSGGFALELTHLPWGAAYWDETGRVVPDDFLEILRGFDAILLGAIGEPRRIPDHVTLEPLIRIRQTFDQYACVRPSRLYPGVRSPLAVPGASKVDLVVVRENSEGEYVNNGGRFKVGEPEEFALQTAIHTRKGIERILRFGFELARKRRKRLTMATKSNAQRYGFVLWDEVLEELRGEYGDVEADKQHIDAAVMNFVRRPETFDVVVGSNLFGDILTDIGGLVGGGLGLAPSANINPERKAPSLFEPVHGSAPDIAGQGIANPVATILGAAMMLEWLGLEAEAERIRRAVAATLVRGIGTPDLGGTLKTAEMADAVINELKDD
ncbi:MAG: tartrate dehydrogenase [Phycisphaerae bacterium]|nr:tartrate dehydrogenase [Phycisphaerae bacterium]